MADLDPYRSKRDLDETPEPGSALGVGRDNRFVVHKHDSSSLHYDFRLEADGVLKSWAVPKGPSTDPSERRLAIVTEDHPAAYIDFEGIIADGEYGAGTVMVWDTGTYEDRTTNDGGERIPVSEAIENGHLVVWLHGQKLTGGYAITRTGTDDRWLLVKMDDEAADARRRPTSTEPDSVETDRSLEEIGEHNS